MSSVPQRAAKNRQETAEFEKLHPALVSTERCGLSRGVQTIQAAQ
jgi:hypothetical protein